MMAEGKSLRLVLPLSLMLMLSLVILFVPDIFCRSPLPGSQSGTYRDVPEAANPSLLKEALFYEALPRKEVRCQLCPRQCQLEDGMTGDCRVRRNLGGKLYALNYGKSIIPSLEPIEKAPFYHFMPGHVRLCVATVGCNLRCMYCQNWQLSQTGVEEAEFLVELEPQQIVDFALQSGARSICFTFSEPISFYEYMYDIAVIAKENGLKTSMVSAGYINEEPLRMLLEVLDAVKIDLKGFREEFYEDVVYGELAPILNTLQIIRDSGKWLEIVNLVVPTLNDDPGDWKRMSSWIARYLGTDVPLHFTRFHPMYRLTHLPLTPVETLEAACSIARQAGLNYLYIGNVPGHPLNATYCPGCGERLIHRVYLSVAENLVEDGRCPFCGERIAGIHRLD